MTDEHDHTYIHSPLHGDDGELTVVLRKDVPASLFVESGGTMFSVTIAWGELEEFCQATLRAMWEQRAESNVVQIGGRR